ncbi:serine hydrolase [Actinomadura sp. 9N407]|uniref:serine hydrolase n=1 Tax=Actinomadura sp. 9N407 TaxID=3375154 RepID=UPI00378A46D2
MAVDAGRAGTVGGANGGVTRRAAFDRSGLRRSLNRYLAERPGRVSVAVRDLATGLSYAHGTKLRPGTASIVKVQIVMALLLQARREERMLTSDERDLAERAIVVSDNDAATALWRAIGGGAGLAEAGRRLGLKHTEPGQGTAWGATTTSATDQVRLLAALTSAGGPLSSRDRHHVLGLMRNVVPEQAWGVSAAAGDGAEVALKNGWLPRVADGGAWTVNSIGRIHDGGHDYLIAVVSDHHASMAEGVEAVEHAGATVVSALARAGDDAGTR